MTEIEPRLAALLEIEDGTRVAGTAARLFGPEPAALPEPDADPPAVARLNHDDVALDRAQLRARVAAGRALGARGFEMIYPYTLHFGRRASLTRDLVGTTRRDAAPFDLTVMLETGELREPDLIAAVARVAIGCGAAAIGTATGRGRFGSDPRAAEILMRLASDAEPPRRVKIGGLTTPHEARSYLTLADGLLGPAWADPTRLRLGIAAAP